MKKKQTRGSNLLFSSFNLFLLSIIICKRIATPSALYCSTNFEAFSSSSSVYSTESNMLPTVGKVKLAKKYQKITKKQQNLK